MRITRRGTNRDHGPASIEFRNIEFSYQASDGLLHIKSWNIADFRADAAHNYDVTLSVQELEQLVSCALKAIPKPGS